MIHFSHGPEDVGVSLRGRLDLHSSVVPPEAALDLVELDDPIRPDDPEVGNVEGAVREAEPFRLEGDVEDLPVQVEQVQQVVIAALESVHPEAIGDHDRGMKSSDASFCAADDFPNLAEGRTFACQLTEWFVFPEYV